MALGNKSPVDLTLQHSIQVAPNCRVFWKLLGLCFPLLVWDLLPHKLLFILLSCIGGNDVFQLRGHDTKIIRLLTAEDIGYPPL